MKHKIIFIALDCSISKAKSIIKSIPKINSKKYKFALKIGYQIFFAKDGRKFIKSIKNFKIFLEKNFIKYMFFSLTGRIGRSYWWFSQIYLILVNYR